MSNKILVVDDDINICEILSFNLENEGYKIKVAYSAEEALKKIDSSFSLILLDVMMKGMSGFSMAERLRKEGITTPIIFLTAKDTESDLINGFSVGADDYISKPFSLKEVSARVKAVITRSQSECPHSTLVIGDMTITTDTKEVKLGEQDIILTKTEFEILHLLVAHPFRIFSREDIIQKIWSDAPYITERTIDVHITRIRKKLGDHSSWISNRFGYGYRFSPNE